MRFAIAFTALSLFAVSASSVAAAPLRIRSQVGRGTYNENARVTARSELDLVIRDTPLRAIHVVAPRELAAALDTHRST